MNNYIPELIYIALIITSHDLYCSIIDDIIEVYNGGKIKITLPLKIVILIPLLVYIVKQTTMM